MPEGGSVVHDHRTEAVAYGSGGPSTDPPPCSMITPASLSRSSTSVTRHGAATLGISAYKSRARVEADHERSTRNPGAPVWKKPVRCFGGGAANSSPPESSRGKRWGPVPPDLPPWPAQEGNMTQIDNGVTGQVGPYAPLRQRGPADGWMLGDRAQPCVPLPEAIQARTMSTRVSRSLCPGCRLAGTGRRCV